MKKTVSIVVLIVFTALFGCGKGTSEARRALEQYIEALRKGDFQTLYELNSVTQRKVALIHRSTEQDKEGSLKKNFEEYKAMFDSIQNEGISNAVWAEKFLFPADSRSTISTIIVEEDKDSVTARFRKRWVARAEVKVEYSNKETAPIYGEERIKAATFMVVLISGEDVVRGLQKTTTVSDWLFKSVNLKDGKVEYWPAR